MIFDYIITRSPMESLIILKVGFVPGDFILQKTRSRLGELHAVDPLDQQFKPALMSSTSGTA